MNLSDEIKNYALELGFHIVKIIPADELEIDGEYLQNWLDKGFAGELEYMKKQPQRRSNPKQILPNAKSMICLAINYYRDFDNNDLNNSLELGRVARYAWGKDYHIVIEKKLKKLRAFIIEKTRSDHDIILQKNDFKIYTDAGPLLERAYAARAGVGVIGKNGMLITQEYGSWVLLAELLTTLDLDYDEVIDYEHDRFSVCGTCRRCIDACPMHAIIEPGEMDARKCISYQTIENCGKIPDEIYEKMGNRIFGCDICQEVCPHNSRVKQTDVKEFLIDRAGATLDINELQSMGKASNGQSEFDKKYQGSPIRRTGLTGLIRNAKNMLKSIVSNK